MKPRPPLLVARIPLALTALRALLAPVVVLLAFAFPNRSLFGACLVVAFVSDIFDGVIARRLNVATPGLRRLDSIADSVFYVAAVLAVWHLYPAVIEEHLPELLVLGSLEIARYGFDFAKFRREASYHMWSSKLWGIFLFVGFYCLLALGLTGLPVTLAIYAGIVADSEGLAISMILPEWKTDVPTFIHAFRIRSLQSPGASPAA